MLYLLCHFCSPSKRLQTLFHLQLLPKTTSKCFVSTSWLGTAQREYFTRCRQTAHRSQRAFGYVRRPKCSRKKKICSEIWKDKGILLPRRVPTKGLTPHTCHTPSIKAPQLVKWVHESTQPCLHISADTETSRAVCVQSQYRRVLLNLKREMLSCWVAGIGYRYRSIKKINITATWRWEEAARLVYLRHNTWGGWPFKLWHLINWEKKRLMSVPDRRTCVFASGNKCYGLLASAAAAARCNLMSAVRIWHTNARLWQVILYEWALCRWNTRLTFCECDERMCRQRGKDREPEGRQESFMLHVNTQPSIWSVSLRLFIVTVIQQKLLTLKKKKTRNTLLNAITVTHKLVYSAIKKDGLDVMNEAGKWNNN